MSRKPLFSVTAADCDWDYTIGSGNGGQNKQKRKTAVRCTHRASGAVGFSQEGRSQDLNKQKAFEKMANTKEFQDWNKIEVSRRTGELKALEDRVDRMMKEEFIKTEIKEDGKWTEKEIEDEG